MSSCTSLDGRRSDTLPSWHQGKFHDLPSAPKRPLASTPSVLDAGVALVNCIPVFIVSDPEFSRRFQERGIRIVGDDIKAQLGATITHRVLTDLFHKRGVELVHTYQLNTGVLRLAVLGSTQSSAS